MRVKRGSAMILVAGLIAGMVAPAAAQKAPAAPDPPSRIDIAASPIASFDNRDPTRIQFGSLAYRGGLVLTSSSRNFGGFSAIRMAPEGGDFVALNDRAWWLRGRIAYAGRRPSAVVDAEIAPILASDGRAITARGWYDTEALAQDGGTLYVALERVHRILRFDYGKSGLLARGMPIAVPPEMRKLPPNQGIEALVFVPRGRPLGGTLIAIAETGRSNSGDHLGFLIGGPQPGSFEVRRKDGFSITDATLTPGGDLLVLERLFGWTTGLFIRIRRLALADVRPGAMLDGPSLFEADLGQQIDNMEAIAVHRSEGETVVTMISDNNFSALQRTLLLQFTLAEP